MSRDIADGNGKLSISTFITGNKIIIVATGFITINTSAGDIQPFYLRIFIGQKVLLNFTSKERASMIASPLRSLRSGISIVISLIR